MLKFFKKLFDFFTRAAARAAQLAQNIAADALPLLADIAARTKNRTDDEILGLFTAYGVPGAQAYLALPAADRGAALLKVATSVLAARFPDVATHVIQLAVQMALTQLRADPPSLPVAK